ATIEAVTDWSGPAFAWGVVGVIIALLVVCPVLGWLLSRIRLGAGRDAYFDGVPPGTVGSRENVRRGKPGGPLPTRYTPPSATPLEVGLVLDRRVKPRHLTSTLLNMAVNGAVRLRPKPFTVWQQDPEKVTSELERSLFEQA